MATDDRLKNLRGQGRRDFLRWSTAVAAALGVSRSSYLDFLGSRGGVALADGATQKVNRSISFVAGTGGLANFTLVFPYPTIAKGTNAQSAFHAMGKAVDAKTDQPYAYAPESPFQKLAPKDQMSVFVAGTNQTHTATPALDAAAGATMLASMAAIQQASPSLLPVIAVNPVTYGVAPGAPAAATVASPAGLVDLFNSSASKALLSSPQDAALMEAYYKAFLGLNGLSGRSSVDKAYGTGKVAANLLGQNLADRLKPTADDLTMYGIATGTPTAVSDLANAMITGVKAMQLGLTSMLVLPAFRDDPHGLFAGGDAAAATKAAQIGKLFDGLASQAAAVADPSGGTGTLWDSLVLTIHGDTPKAAQTRSGWPDNTAGNHNLVMVRGAGQLKTGFFGNDQGQGWDNQTGAVAAGRTSAQCTVDATAAVLFAVAKGDARKANATQLGSGVVNLSITG